VLAFRANRREKKQQQQKQKHRPIKDNAHRQDLVSAYTENDANYCVNNNHFPQTLRRIVYALQNFDRNFPNLVAPTTDASAKFLVRCKAHLLL